MLLVIMLLCYNSLLICLEAVLEEWKRLGLHMLISVAGLIVGTLISSVLLGATLAGLYGVGFFYWIEVKQSSPENVLLKRIRKNFLVSTPVIIGLIHIFPILFEYFTSV